MVSDCENQPILRPHEFACLHHETLFLYLEIIDVIAVRQRYWARPIVMREAASPPVPEPMGVFGEPFTVYDVRKCPDLLWPSSLFRCVFDTELLPLLDYLEPKDPVLNHRLTTADKAAQQKLQELTQKIWQNFPHAFQTTLAK